MRKELACSLSWCFLAVLVQTPARAATYPVPYRIGNTQALVDLCPQNDPIYSKIRADFEIRRDGVIVSGDVPCSEPYSQTPLADFKEELRLLQALRIAYYMDYGRTGHLPWTSLGMYDWLKSKVGGFNIDSTATFNSCCVYIGGKYLITLNTVKDDLNRQYGLKIEGIVALLALLGHEARHMDGFGHVSCCGISGGCDNTYDLANLAPYGIQFWLYKTWLEGGINLGFGVLPASRPMELANALLGGANGYVTPPSRFCTNSPPTVAMPAAPGGQAPLSPTAVWRDPTGSIDLSDYRLNGSFSPGGTIVSEPGSSQRQNGDTVIAATDAFGGVWDNWFYASPGAWAGWNARAGISKGNPAVAVTTGDLAYVVVRDGFDAGWMARETAGGFFYGWTGLGGVFGSDLSAAAGPDGAAWFAGRDHYDSLWVGRAVGDVFGGWRSAGGIFQGEPSIAVGSDNTAYIAVRDKYNALWVARMTPSALVGWTLMGGMLSSDPKIAAGGVGSLTVAAVDMSSGGWMCSFAESAGTLNPKWRFIGGILKDISPAVVGSTVSFAGRDLYNGVWWYTPVPGQWRWANASARAMGRVMATPR